MLGQSLRETLRRVIEGDFADDQRVEANDRVARQAEFRTGEADELMNKVSALSVRSNAVLVWNTTRMTEIIAALEKTSGQAIPMS
jgi:hypothetical protein